MLSKTKVQQALRSLALLKFYPASNPEADRVVVGIFRELFDSDTVLERVMAKFLRDYSEWTGPGAFYGALSCMRRELIQLAKNECTTCDGEGFIPGFAKLMTWPKLELVKDNLTETEVREWDEKMRADPEIRRKYGVYSYVKFCNACELGRRKAQYCRENYPQRQAA